MAFVSMIEPKNIKEAIIDDNWIIAMQEELNQFERNNVQKLVEKPENYPVIGTKQVFRNKLDEHGIIIGNKARLVAKRYNQKKEQTMKKHMLLLQDQKPLEYSQHMHP